MAPSMATPADAGNSVAIGRDHGSRIVASARDAIGEAWHVPQRIHFLGQGRAFAPCTGVDAFALRRSNQCG
ncbi:MAG: hypothetical protein IID40_04175 [Planctomycetes bacterium]|nr:hypothetical protein [Planctomycetota bacterium]